MADEKKQEVAGDTKPARSKRTTGPAVPAPALSGVEQVKAELSARADTMPVTPPAPDSDALLPAKPAGSGIHDAFGVELPTVEEFIRLGGKAEDYDAYLLSRCAIKPASVAAATPAPEAPKAMVGKSMAEQILADAFKKRTGQSIEPPLRDEDLREDWHEVQAGKRAPAPVELAGLYIVTHGVLWFSKDKIVPKGRKVYLDADDAKAFLEREHVRPLKTAA